MPKSGAWIVSRIIRVACIYQDGSVEVSEPEDRDTKLKYFHVQNEDSEKKGIQICYDGGRMGFVGSFGCREEVARKHIGKDFDIIVEAIKKFYPDA